MARRTTSYDLPQGFALGLRYRVQQRLGAGSEGEVYRVADRRTGLIRAAKLFYPHADPDRRRSDAHARKLDKLRLCPIVLQYYHSEELEIQGRRAVAVVSELCEGEPLARWLARQRGQRLGPYTALVLLHRLAFGLEQVHATGQYHADVHSENILVRRAGIDFELKLIDFYEWGRPSRAKQQQDILAAVHLLHELVGGPGHYAKQPAAVKAIVRGKRSDLILKHYPTMHALRRHLETFDADGLPT